MTDNIIPRDEAIDRMKAGLPCETLIHGESEWTETRWIDFDCDPDLATFRKPPEPRRVARRFEGVWRVHTPTEIHNLDGTVTLQEVLPGDVVLQPMTEKQVRAEFKEQWGHRGWTSHRELCEEWWIASRRVLGLIGEGS